MQAKKEAVVAATTSVSRTLAGIAGSHNEQQHQRERMGTDADKDDDQSDLYDFDSIEGGSAAVVVTLDIGNLPPIAEISQYPEVERVEMQEGGKVCH
ncbi:UNVERIFIED_CONTAM: hypothetical protein HDU68_009034 [Siphonaria sp. JEL0065]|nr:hypothetical protein HDU68_009034 [Siphonaria sp. JEL0065]